MKATIVIDIKTLTPDERKSVAKNLFAVESSIDDLIANGGSSVAYGLLENPNLPTDEILQKLSKIQTFEYPSMVIHLKTPLGVFHHPVPEETFLT